MFFVCGSCQSKGLCVSEEEGEKYPPRTKESVQNSIYKQDIISVLRFTSASYQAVDADWAAQQASLFLQSSSMSPRKNRVNDM